LFSDFKNQVYDEVDAYNMTIGNAH